MSTKFYRNAQGQFVGGFDGASPPIGSIEVASPPADARMTWDGVDWVISAGAKDAIIDSRRQGAYNDQGSSIEEMIVALWERVVEAKPAASDAIQLIRDKIKNDFPK